MTGRDVSPEKAMAPHSTDTTERLHFHFSLSCIGEGNGNPLQCSCLENPRDEGAWWAVVYVAQSGTLLKRLSSSSRDVSHCYFSNHSEIDGSQINMLSKLEWGITSLSSEWPSSKHLQTMNAGEGVEKREPSGIVSWSVNWYNHYGEQYGGFFKKKIHLL